MSKNHRAKRVARYAAFGAVGGALALSPLGLSYADPAPGTDGVAPVTVTATVTAVIAPDQCDPLPDGRLPQRAVDYSTTGDDIVIPEPSAVPAPEGVPELFTGNVPLAPADELEDAPREDEEGVEGQPIEGTGPFDPYLCDPAGAAPETITITPEPVAPGPDLEDIPGVTPTLRPYPGAGGLADGAVGQVGPQLGNPDEEARPTEEPLPGERGVGGGALAPAPAPRAIS